ncbi:MAG: hypothetical protein BWY75_03754 [bacterium ADurb.Bin425]|nr:MAG: hypothetical protein BWY75_03754 [bacterium ADurb.Bin425]
MTAHSKSSQGLIDSDAAMRNRAAFFFSFSAIKIIKVAKPNSNDSGSKAERNNCNKMSDIASSIRLDRLLLRSLLTLKKAKRARVTRKIARLSVVSLWQLMIKPG